MLFGTLRLAELFNIVIILLPFFFSSGPENADLIAGLPIGTKDVYFQMMKATHNSLGKKIEKRHTPNPIILNLLFHSSGYFPKASILVIKF